jgi:hypothetical protein
MLCCTLVATTRAENGNLIINPQTEKLWNETPPPGITAELKEGKGFIIIDGGNRQVRLPIAIPPTAKFIRIRMRMRISEIIPGEKDWQDARLAMRFYNSDWKSVGSWPNIFRGRGTREWFDCDRLYPVPEGAAQLLLEPANFGKSGKVEFSHLNVEAVTDPESIDRDVTLPAGLINEQNSSMKNAWVSSTSSRKRICLNGLWRFRPLKTNENVSEKAPRAGAGWGYFKVPGAWPRGNGLTNSFQPLLPDDVMKEARDWHTAWYKRKFTVPGSTTGKKIFLDIEGVQTRARIYVDSEAAGEIVFPGGIIDITRLIRPGEAQMLEIRLSAIPLSEEHFVAMDGDNITKVAAKVMIKGISGDVFLDIVPEQRISNVHFITSVKNGDITFDCGLKNLNGENYFIEAEIYDRDNAQVKTFRSKTFSPESLNNGRFRFSGVWKYPELWDINTPQNLYFGKLTLYENDKAVDVTIPERFGFREFTIEGQNYMLNGVPIHLRAYLLPNYSAEWMTDKASKESSLEAFRRLKEMGFNFTISRNYNFAEGRMFYMRGHCNAADEFGHLHSVSLPHPWQFSPPVSENSDAYAKMTEYIIHKYWNHPSIILWVTNHNRGGAWGDQNPLRLGGEYQRANNPAEVETKEKSRNNFFAAQKRINEIDSSRPVYNHAAGCIGGHYTLNMYLNWAPKQERNDWLEHFYHNGKYPLSFVEWGLPHIASFSSHRFPNFIWSTKAVMTVWDAEYIAAEFGDNVALWTPEREELLDRLIKNANEPASWHPLSKLTGRLPNVQSLQADYFDENLRNLRAWNIAMILPWDDYAFWKSNGSFPPVENPDRMKNLNAPGVVPDFFNWGDYILNAHPEAFSLSVLGKTIKRWNQPLIAWIGGENVFTTQEHIYKTGETIKKQLVILNDCRVPVKCNYMIKINNTRIPALEGQVEVKPGSRAFVPFEFRSTATLHPGIHEIQAEFNFEGKGIKENASHNFKFTIMAKPEIIKNLPPVALYDPKGLSEKLLIKLNIPYKKVGLDDDFTQYKTLIIGREALNSTDKLPNLDGVRDGLNVLIFEQSTALMERLGFRINEQGLRRLFPRMSEHPVLEGFSPEMLANWRGEATLLSPYLDYSQFFCPEWQWCGFKNTRVWRCRNRGTLANVLLEKPSIGNFSPVLDGGFALQYAPLLEYKEGKGHILFCQVEVSSRSEDCSAGELLAVNLINYIRTAPPVTEKNFAVIAGEKFKKLLKDLRLQGEKPLYSDAEVIIVGPGAHAYPDLTKEVSKGKTLLTFGLSSRELKSILPEIEVQDNHKTPSMTAEFNHRMLDGVSNLDTYFQTRLDFSTVNGKELSAFNVGDGVCVTVGVSPEMLDYNKLFRLRSSFRRRLFLMTQLLRNSGIASACPMLDRFKSAPQSQPWLNSYYIQVPIANDDPYRYYHW